MKKMIFSALFFATTVANAQYTYPDSKTIQASDTYFGTTIYDPYRWLEDLKNQEVQDWFKTQADYTNTQLAKIPNLDKLIQEFKNYDETRPVQYFPLVKAGGKYFYQKRLPGDQTSKLYYRQGETGKEILLFDPQKYVEGKTFNYTASVNDDGSKVVLSLSEGGSEIGDMRILDVATGKLLPDIIQHSFGGIAEGSASEIIYAQAKSYDTHDPEALQNAPCKLHIIGTPVEKDVVLASSKKNPGEVLVTDLPFVSFFKNSPYMILRKYTTENNLALYYALKQEIKNNTINWKPLTTKNDEVRSFFIDRNDIYFLSAKGNPNFKLIKTSFENLNLQVATTVAEGNKAWQISTDGIQQTKDYLIFNKTKNELVTKLFSYEYNTGEIAEINIPVKGNVHAIGLSKSSNEIVLATSGWILPYNFYSYDLRNKKMADGIFNMQTNLRNLENLVYEEIEIPSYDGALVPLSIIYDKTTFKKDGKNIGFMLGYGAYGNIDYPPSFNANTLSLLSRGVVIAYAHVRGGGEKGDKWHLEGKKATKPNTWKDFNECAEYLVKNKYTSTGKFGISGESAGGILIGRAITERPDLYKVAIPEVGLLNVLRNEFTGNGPPNIPEFGTVTIEEEFKALLEMDAYQHIQKGVKYPAQLITTGMNDPRVESYIPAKFAAKMQADN
ncbi:MAG: prolyl oligopeptidase family serine peptidase, partial [Bacteroidota bacterium]|nr:prolyl oligopeptidase family serine peptidase [Bacteroidota bacterium]